MTKTTLRIREGVCPCGCSRDEIIDTDNNIVGFICVICGERQKPPQIEYEIPIKKIIICHKCSQQKETGIFNPPTCWNCKINSKKTLF